MGPINALPFNTDIVHSVATEELAELASVFAIEALLPEETEAYLAHLVRCGFCQGLASQFQAVADLLPDALEEPTSRPALKERILRQVRQDLEGRRPTPGATLAESVRAATARWKLLSPFPLPVGALAVLLLLAVGLVAWNIQLQLKTDGQDDRLTEQQRLIRALPAGASLSHLAGTESAPQASGTLVYSFGGREALLLVRNLPSLEREQVYQVWSITGKEPTGVGIFTLTNAREQLVSLSTDFSGADAIGISIEPKGGSSKPTGAIVLLGSL